MLGRARRHPVVSALALLLAIGVVAVAAGAWYLLGEARRSGRIVSRVLSHQLGVPVSVERARPDGPRRIVLYGVHVPPGKHWDGDVRVRELRVDGGILPIIFPQGQALSIVAVSTSVTLADKPAAPPTAAALEALRGLIAESTAWPGDVAIEVLGAELRSASDLFTMDLVGRKQASGALAISVKVMTPDGKQALALELTSPEGRSPDERRVTAHVKLDGEPPRLAALWPAGLPVLAHVSLEGAAALVSGGDLEIKGRLAATPAGEIIPLSAQFVSRYHAVAPRLDLSALSLTWGPGTRLEGKATVEELDRVARLTFDMKGIAEGTSVNADGTYVPTTGLLSARVQTQALASRTLLARAGLGSSPVDVTVRGTRSTLDGTLGQSGGRLTVESALEGIEVRELLPKTPLAGAFRGQVAFRRGRGGLELSRLEASTLALTRAGATVATIAATSPADAAWPIAIEAAASDLRRLPVGGLPLRLTGTARVTGALARSGDTLRFTGDATAELPRVESTLGGSTVLLNTRVRLPVAWGTAAGPGRGSAFVERVEANGLTLDRLISSAELVGGRLALPDMKWVHYGGHGWGWLEVALDGRPVPVRARLEGERIDLTTLTREYGVTAAQVSGKVRYLLVVQYGTAAGLVAVGQVNSEDDGGRVSIEVIEKLLESAQVQAESSGVLKQTLENLRVFDYTSLEGDVRVTPNGGYVNLSLVGKKRLGIFPAPVKAINLRNVPIALLVRLFSRRDVT